MLKLKQLNRNPNDKANYSSGKKIVPKIQWYLLATFLLLPIIYLLGKIIYDNFYPHANGIIVAEEFTVNAPNEGYIKRINIQQGSKVLAGELLVEIKSEIIESQMTELNHQKQKLSEDKKAYKNTEITELNELKVQAFAQIKSSKEYYQNLLAYQKQGVVTLLQLHDAQLQYLSAQQEYKMIIARITQTRLNFEVNNLQIFDDDIRKLEIELNILNNQRASLKLIAPINGSIKDIAVHKGEFVTKDKAILIISSLDHFRVLAFVDAKFLAKVQPGNSVRLILPNKEIYGGVVENIPSFTNKLYSGLDLIGSQNERKPVIIIKPNADFPANYKVNGIEVEVLL